MEVKNIFTSIILYLSCRSLLLTQLSEISFPVNIVLPKY